MLGWTLQAEPLLALVTCLCLLWDTQLSFGPVNVKTKMLTGIHHILNELDKVSLQIQGNPVPRIILGEMGIGARGW